MRSLSRSNKLLALLAALSLVGCQPPAKPTATQTKSTAPVVAADVSLETDLINLGKVRMGEVKTFETVIHNNTSKPLHFQGFKTSCSCSNLTVTEKELPPGGIVRVTGEFRGQGAYGMFNRTIYIQWGEAEPAALRLTGELYRDLVFEPASLELTPQMASHQADEKDVMLFNRSDTAVTVEWPSLPDGLTTSQTRFVVPAQSSVSFKVKAEPVHLIKNQFQLTASSNLPREERLQLPVIVKPRDALMVHPMGFHWGLLSQKEWQTKMPLRVKLWGPLLDSCEVSNIECPGYLVPSAAPEADKPGERVIWFSAQSEQAPVSLNNKIVIHLKVKGQAQLVPVTIPVTGLLRDSQVARREP